jgi:hypothetical protein
VAIGGLEDAAAKGLTKRALVASKFGSGVFFKEKAVAKAEKYSRCGSVADQAAWGELAAKGAKSLAKQVSARRIGALGIAACLATAATSTGCSETPDTKTLMISGVTYTFPRDQVDAISSEDGRPYARVHAPGSEFYLEHSDRSSWPNEQGLDVPTIPLINAAPGPHNANIEVLRTSAGVVVCDRSPRPEYDCGMEVVDAGVTWSVHFNKRHLPRIDALKSSVEKALASYRR